MPGDDILRTVFPGKLVVKSQRHQADDGVQRPRLFGGRCQGAAFSFDKFLVQQVRQVSVKPVVTSVAFEQSVASQHQVQLPQGGGVLSASGKPFEFFFRGTNPGGNDGDALS